MEIGDIDRKVIMAFINKRAMSSKKLTTNAIRLDGNWMGGGRIAEWKDDKIVFNDLGSKAAMQVQKLIRKNAPRGFLATESNFMRRASDVLGAELDEMVPGGSYWSSDVKTKWRSPSGLFKKSGKSIATELRSASDSKKQAVSRLNFYANRAGSKLSEKDRGRIAGARRHLSRMESENIVGNAIEVLSDIINEMQD